MQLCLQQSCLYALLATTLMFYFIQRVNNVCLFVIKLWYARTLCQHCLHFIQGVELFNYVIDLGWEEGSVRAWLGRESQMGNMASRWGGIKPSECHGQSTNFFQSHYFSFILRHPVKKLIAINQSLELQIVVNF